jgi:putative ABC transport system permease protein
MKHHSIPPSWIDRLIDSLAPHEYAEEIRGDLYELYVGDLKDGRVARARRRYVLNGLGFLAKSFFWKKSSASHMNYFGMVQNYFKMARRSLMAYKGTTFINVLGLITGIAAALVLFAVVRYDLSFDSFHSDRDRVYRLVRVSLPELAANRRSDCRAGISYPVPAALAEAVPGIEQITSMQYFGDVFVEVPDASGTVLRRYREESGCVMIEPSFFRIFDYQATSFHWIAGDPATALNDPLSVVLTRSLADKYFPEGNAIGMTLRLEHDADCKVTGIVEDLPPNTDFPFTVMVSYATLKMAKRNMMNDWVSVDDEHQTLIKLTADANPADVEGRIAKVHQAHTSEDIYKGRHYLLQPLATLHFDTRFENFAGRTISKDTLLALGIIGLFLILTASINYINLATAQSVMRAKEIGLRKVMGSSRKHIVGQFLAETFVVVLIAGTLALLLSEVLLVNLRSLLYVQKTGYIFMDPQILLAVAGIIVIVTLLAGFYPSMALSRFNPVTTLKNKFATEKVGGFSLRKVLVVAQFAITQILVVGTFIVVAQMNFFRNADMGFNQEAIVTVPLPGKRDLNKLQALENQFRIQPFVADVSLSSTLPSGLRRSRNAMSIGRADANLPQDYEVFEYSAIDPSYLGVYGIRLLAGRNIIAHDSATDHVLINKQLVKNLDMGTPEEAVGKGLKLGGKTLIVAGVVDNYYGNSLKEGVGNMMLEMKAQQYRVASIKLDLREGVSVADQMKSIERIWSGFYPDYIFEYEFFDQNVQAFYEQEQKYARLFEVFSVIFLIIGCLGLYGLITFVVNRKGKEVALRKVLGATVADILLMFSREYVQLIVLSFAIAIPVAYYAVKSWLSNFANHIDLSWWLFVLPGLVVLVIALVVVAGKSLRTANANPVDRLKYE